MLAIKLARFGKKKQPTYRIVVLEKTKDPFGDYLENLGHYNPRTEPSTLELKKDRVEHWLSKGAQPTDTVHNLLVEAGIVKDKKRSASKLGKKFKAKVAEEAEKAKAAEEEAKAAAEAAKAEAEAPANPEPAEGKEEAPKEEAKEEPKAEEPKEEKKEEPAKEESKAE